MTSAHLNRDNAPIIAHAPCRADLAGATLDLWPLYLFHPGALTLNFALTIKTTCRITPRDSSEIHFKSLDTGREERFASFGELLRAKSYKHPIGAWLVRAFFGDKGVGRGNSERRKPETRTGAPKSVGSAGRIPGFTLETHSQSRAGAGISGSSALMIATT